MLHNLDKDLERSDSEKEEEDPQAVASFYADDFSDREEEEDNEAQMMDSKGALPPRIISRT